MASRETLAFYEMIDADRTELELRAYIKTLPAELQQALKELNALYPI